MNTESSIFGSGDPPPKRLYPFGQQAPFVLVSDHAGRAVPESLGDLGVSAADWDRHIAYDIGIHSVGVELAKRLKVPLLEQPYSRLVIDCNRAPGHPTSIPESSDGTAIPANRNLSTSNRQRREQQIFKPYQEAIAETLRACSEPRALISLHSFTPTMARQVRPWHVGILYHKDTRSADIMRDLLKREPDLCVGDNEPYVMTATSDYTIPHHAEAAGRPYLEIEIRQDLIANDEGQSSWAKRLAKLLPIYWDMRSKML